MAAGARSLALGLPLALGSLAAAAQTWDFQVSLDGKPIGTHRFVVAGPASAREVESTARLDVKLLGLTVYRYRHEARERWQGDCLRELRSRTDDDGKLSTVDLAPVATADCMVSFAYWHAGLPTQARLLNPQTGVVEEVGFERLPDAALAVGGRGTVDAVRWRLRALASRQDITLWLDRADGSWIGLDAQVKGGRLLTYRLH